MSSHAPDVSAERPPRVAVVVVPGVGDDGRGETVDTLANSLVRRGYFDWAIEDEVVVPSQARSRRPMGKQGAGRDAYVQPPADSYAAPRRRLGSGPGPRPPAAAEQPEDQSPVSVDLYEMNWSDLSRFPSGLGRFMFALFGLVLQLGRGSLEALRGLRPDEDATLVTALKRQRTPRRSLSWSWTTTRWLSLWMAIVIVPTTVLVALVGLALLLVTLTSSRLLQVGGLILFAAFAAWLTFSIGRATERNGLGPEPPEDSGAAGPTAEPDGRVGRLAHHAAQRLRYSAIAWTAAVVLVGLVAAVLYGNRGQPGSLEVTIANTLLGAMAGPLRLVWLVGASLSLIALFALSTLLASDWRERNRSPRGVRWRAASVGALSVTTGPFVLALVCAALLTVAGSVGLSVAGNASWGQGAVDLRCLSGANDWTPDLCLAESERLALRNQIAAADRAEPSAGEPEDRPQGYAEDVQRQEAAEDKANTIIENAGAAPDAWLPRLAQDIFAPVVIAGLSLIAMFAFALAATVFRGLRALSLGPEHSDHHEQRTLRAFGGLAYFPLLGLEKVGLLSRASSRAHAGAALSGLLRRIDSLGTLLLVSLTSIVAIAGTYWIWVFGGSFFGLDQRLAALSAGISLGVAAVLIAVRFLPINLLEVMRSGLDIGYDVVTYVRAGETAARFAVVSRYRALLSQIVQIEHDDGDSGYDGIVFVAHSQGSIYTAATLFGDQQRWPVVYTLTQSREERARGGLRDLNSVSMLSFGSPIRQLYDRFFAGQYSDWYRVGTAFAEQPLAPLNDTWLNIYRPGDYVGRAVNRNPSGEGADIPGSETCIECPGADPRRPVLLRDVCIDSPGAHTGYWGTRQVAAYLNYLVQRAAARDECERNGVRLPNP